MMSPAADNAREPDPSAVLADLPGQEVHIWWAEPALLSDEQSQRDCRELLSAQERERCDRFLNEQDQLLYLTAHTLLRRVLSLYAGLSPSEWEFLTGPHGKPELIREQASLRLQFNLTHTPGLVACAVCRGAALGIDVESLERRLKLVALADRYFSAEEAACLKAMPEEHQRVRFFQYWTLKEAFIKAVGDGLTLPLKSFSMQLPEYVPEIQHLPKNQPHLLPLPRIQFHEQETKASSSRYSKSEHDWQFAQWAVSPSYLLSIAVESEAGSKFKLKLNPATEKFLTAGECSPHCLDM